MRRAILKTALVAAASVAAMATTVGSASAQTVAIVGGHI